VHYNLHSTDAADAPATRLHELIMELVRTAGILRAEEPGPTRTLPLSHTFALHEIDRADEELSQRDLAERLGLEKSTVSRLAAHLEALGLLVRERDPENRRSYRLRITSAGRTLHEHLGRAAEARYEAISSSLTEAERDALLVGLPALIRAVHRSGGAML
jgi:DNA-binding MarR family transcriptional regulator